MSQYLCPASARAKKNKLEQGNIRFYSEKETDWLTGLYNREAMAQRITAYIRKGLSGTMIMLDLDHFKQVNDRYGHMAGDRLLQSVAAVLKKWPEATVWLEGSAVMSFLSLSAAICRRRS